MSFCPPEIDGLACEVGFLIFDEGIAPVIAGGRFAPHYGQFVGVVIEVATVFEGKRIDQRTALYALAVVDAPAVHGALLRSHAEFNRAVDLGEALLAGCCVPPAHHASSPIVTRG